MEIKEYSVATPEDFVPVIEQILQSRQLAASDTPFVEGGVGAVGETNGVSDKATITSATAVASGATVVALSGDLGAGKTTCTQQLAAHLGVTDPVVSSTFVVMKSYELDGRAGYDELVHIDAYRFEDESEAGPLRLTEVFTQPRTLVVIEWPERVQGILPAKRIAVSIEIKEGKTRIVTVQSSFD